jgi:tRNA threonylcarbamoyladenosine biosynthesis protein TsaB
MAMSAVLGFDTATAYASVAVTRGAEPVHEEEHGPGGEGRPRHSELLLGAVERCVAEGGGWESIGLIVVGLGPGSYTGLRIGVATARALAQAREIPIAGVSSLAALARGIAEHPDAADRPVLPVIDARRGQAFAAVHGRAGVELRSPFVASPAELAEAISVLDPVPLAAGDGAVRFRQELEAAGALVAPAQDPVHRVAARHLCALGAVTGASAPDRIEPIYLREPDAKRWLERDHGKPAR